MAEDKIMTSFQGYEVVDKKARNDNLVLTSELNCTKEVALEEAIVATVNIANDNTKVGIDGIFLNISWGDGIVDNKTEHTYASAGKYKFVASGCPSYWCLSALPCDEIKVEDTVTELSANGLRGISAKSITIGRNVTSIGSKALWGLRNCTHLEFLNPTPIAPYNPDWFEGDGVGIPDTLKIYVPHDSLEAYKEAWTEIADKITSIAEMNDVEQLKNKVDNCVAKTGHTGRSVIGVRGVTGDPVSDIPFSVDDDGTTIAYRDSNGSLAVGDVDYSSGNRAVNANSFPNLLNHHLQQTNTTQYLDLWASKEKFAKLVNENEIQNGGKERWYTTDRASSYFETEANGIYFEGYIMIRKQGRTFITKSMSPPYRLLTRYELDITIEHLWTNSQKTERASLPAVAIKYLLETKAYRWNLYFPISDAIQLGKPLFMCEGSSWKNKTPLEIKNEIMSAKYMEIAEYSWRWLPEVGETTDTSMLNGNGAVTAQPAYIRFRNDGDDTVYTQFWAMGTAIELDTYNKEPLTIDGAHMKVYIYRE